MAVHPALIANDKDAPAKYLKGQAFVEQVCQEDLRTERINHEHHTNYIDVDLKNQANMEASTMGAYHGRYIFELLQNANDAALVEN